MIYRFLFSIRKVYEITHNCDTCGNTKGNKYIVVSVDPASMLRLNGYHCIKCIPEIVTRFSASGYDTAPFSFILKLIKLGKVTKRQDYLLETSLKDIITHSKKTKQNLKKAR